MKKSTMFLAFTLMLAMLVSIVPAYASVSTLGEPIDGYNDYGYYTLQHTT